jgi:hypothetical protein
VNGTCAKKEVQKQDDRWALYLFWSVVPFEHWKFVCQKFFTYTDEKCNSIH